MASLVRAAALTNFAEIARELDYNPDIALRQAGLSLSTLKQPDQRIPAESVVRVLEEAARATGCVSFGLRMALSRQLANWGIVSLLLAHQPTLRNALNTTIEYLHLLNESLALHIEDVDKMVIVREEIVAPLPSRQAVELAIGVLYRMCSTLMGESWHPVSVNFSHATPVDLSTHRQLFRCPVHFNSEFNSIVCRAADLEAPNPLADQGLAHYARHMLETTPLTRRKSIQLEVRKAIYLTLPSGRTTCESVAQGLGCSLRTLQRKLDEEQVSFTQLLNEVRRTLAQRYMNNPGYSTGHVAALLGYSTHSAFTRWFKVQFGSSPAQWRNRSMTAQTAPF